MKKIPAFILMAIMVVFCSNAISQKCDNKYRKLPGISKYSLITGKSPESSFYISEKPVTNREYLTYLCWLYTVYVDYPDIFINAIPSVDAEKVTRQSAGGLRFVTDFSSLVLSESEISRNYVFNPAYIDYPVYGITWNQAMNYLDWLYHRYNEYSLVRKKELWYNNNQTNTNCFTTEAYLASQYEGLVRSLILDEENNGVRRSRWSDYKTFFPSFRLPSRSELILAEKNVSKELKPYKPVEFLDYWTDSFIEVKNDTLILHLDRYGVTVTKITAAEKTANVKFPASHDEFTLDQDIKKNLPDVLEIYKELRQEVIDPSEIDLDRLPSKDNLGYMQFSIIGEDNNCNPVYLKRMKYGRAVKQGEFTIFRFAMNAKRN